MNQHFSSLPAKLAAAVLILPLLLTACGGGGDGAAPADPGQQPVNPDPGGTDPTNPDSPSLHCPPVVTRCASGG